MLSKSSSISLEVCAKSISMYDLYSLLANSSTKVDFPTRRAPFINNAELPLRSRFQASILSYNFRLKTMFLVF